MRLSKNLILASKSAVRADMLRQCGLAFDILPSGIDEDALKNQHTGTPASLAVALAEAKAKATETKAKGVAAKGLIIGADQILQCDNVLYDKPRNIAEARHNLALFRGRTHYLIGAVVLVEKGTTLWSHHQSVALTMRDFSDAFLDTYLAEAGEKILSSVGGYQLEGLGAHLFSAIEGDYFAILGLPLLPLLEALRRHGRLIA